MRYYTYILYSEGKGRYYVGQTSDLDSRLERHQLGQVKSTRGYRPWKIVYYEVYKTRSESVSRELFIKKQKSRRFIERLIKEGSGA